MRDGGVLNGVGLIVTWRFARRASCGVLTKWSLRGVDLSTLERFLFSDVVRRQGEMDEVDEQDDDDNDMVDEVAEP